MAEVKDRQECLCLELEKASSRCLKLGPVVFIRLKAEQGETLPRIETGHFPLGHHTNSPSKQEPMKFVAS